MFKNWLSLIYGIIGISSIFLLSCGEFAYRAGSTTDYYWGANYNSTLVDSNTIKQYA